MSTLTADSILAAIDDARRAWPHNGHLIEDVRLDAAVSNALAGQPLVDEQFDAPRADVRVVSTDTTRCAMSLMDVLAGQRFPHPERCDRCYAPRSGNRALYLRCGATIVQLSICGGCVGFLSDAYAPVVWS